MKWEINRAGMRRANIGAAVGFVVMLVGVILFKDAGEGALQAVCLVGVVCSFGVYMSLDHRARRQRERERSQ